MPRIVIIGASISGHTVAVNLREQDKDSAITLITEEAYTLYDRRRLTDLLAGNIKESDIFLGGEDAYRNDNIEFIKDAQVYAVNPNKKAVSLKGRDRIEYDFLVIASGKRQITPDIPGAKKPGVFTFGSLSELKAFSNWLITEQVCIVGHNADALNLSRAVVTKYKVEVKLISDTNFDPVMLLPEIEIINNKPQELIGEGQTQAVKLDSGKIIAASAVIFMDDLVGNTDFLKDSGIESKGDCIVVDEFMRTNLNGVYACGTVAVNHQEEGKAKAWDDCISEGKVLAGIIMKTMRG